MQLAFYLRDEAVRFRALADQQVDETERIELLDLAAACEEIANTDEERSTAG